MKVWIVSTQSVYYGENEMYTNVFATHDGAKAEFDKLVKEVEENDHLRTVGTIEKSETSFCIYKDGQYCDDHYEINMEEKEVIVCV